LARRNPRCAGFVHAKKTARITSAILASEAASQRHSSSNISYSNAATSTVRFEQGDEKKERLSVTEYREMKGCAACHHAARGARKSAVLESKSAEYV
jgi:hypothetical protein